jgi:hypothetical protein
MGRIRRRIGILLFYVFCLCLPAIAGGVTLAWDPVTAATLAGYKVHYGTSPRSYVASIPIGTATTYTFPDGFLLAGKTYYFAVSAYDSAGNESGYSNEVSKTFPTCDINNDGTIGNPDVLALADAILGKIPVSKTYDLNEDNSINVLDLQIMQNAVSGNRSCP